MAIWQLFRAQDEHRLRLTEEAAAAGEDAPEDDLAPSFEDIKKTRTRPEAYKGQREEKKDGSGRVFGKKVVDPDEVVRRWFTNMKHGAAISEIKNKQAAKAEEKKAGQTGMNWLLKFILGDESVDE